MQSHFGKRLHCDQASAILDSKSEEAWGETKKYPGEWELGWKESNFYKPACRQIYLIVLCEQMETSSTAG